LNYGMYPRAICTSVNDVAVHGIPDDVPLAEGDLLKIDVTVYLNGYHGDTCTTLIVGNKGSKAAQKLLHAAHECREAGIEACAPGRQFSEIGNGIECAPTVYLPPLLHSTYALRTTHRTKAEELGVTVSTLLAGHGIGTEFHSDPYVFHVRNYYVGEMKPGNCFTIGALSNSPLCLV